MTNQVYCCIETEKHVKLDRFNLNAANGLKSLIEDNKSIFLQNLRFLCNVDH